MQRKLLPVLLLLIFLIAALLLGNWVYQFHPRNRTEIVHPTSKNRAFTRIDGFVDVSIPLRAADWPHTFAKPALLGDVSSEAYPLHHVHWSADGSVLALRIKRSVEDDWLFSSAYDFHEHSLIQQSQETALSGGNACIGQLMEKRGGIAPALTGIDDGKDMGYKETFPAWGWCPPLLLAAAGLFLSSKIRHGSPARMLSEDR